MDSAPMAADVSPDAQTTAEEKDPATELGN